MLTSAPSPSPARSRSTRGSAVALGTIATLALTLGVGATAAFAAHETPTKVSAGLPASTSTLVDAVPAASGALQPAGGTVAPLPAPVGFGATTTGGSGAPVVHVTSDADSATAPAPGTLRWALAQPGPTWIVFDSDMTIHLAAVLSVPSDTTIDGRGHQVLLTGHNLSGLSLNGVDNVIIESLQLRDFGDTALTEDNDTEDALLVQDSTRVWIDHNTLSHAGDKLVGIQDGSREVTVSWNHFWDQQQTLQIGNMSSATEDVQTTVTVTGNWFDHVGYRMPVVSYAKAHVFNNYMDSWGLYAVRSQRLAQVYLEDNVLQAADARKATTLDPGQLCNDYGTKCDSRLGSLYDTGNLYLGKANHTGTDQSTVFDPHQAYAYTALPATLDLVAAITAGAGAVTTVPPVSEPEPTSGPTTAPTSSPTTAPTTAPTSGPTTAPTTAPTSGPTTAPTTAPTSGPTTAPTTAPTVQPTSQPTVPPTEAPTPVVPVEPVPVTPAPTTPAPVLDARRGKSGRVVLTLTTDRDDAGLRVSFYRKSDSGWTLVDQANVDAKGRAVAALSRAESAPGGVYRAAIASGGSSAHVKAAARS